MKNIILTTILLFLALSLSSQVKVFTNGRTVLGNNSGITPVEAAQIVGNIAMNSPETGGTIQQQRAHAIYGVGGSKNLRFSTNSTSQNSFAYIAMFGDGTCAACAPLLPRKGEMAMGGQYFNWRVGANNLGSVGALAMELDINKDLLVTGDVYSGGVLISSDKKLKRDIKDFELGLNEVLNIQPKKYFYNGKGGVATTRRQHVGVIAQDFQKINPIGVAKRVYNDIDNDVKEEFLAVDEGQIKFMLVNAVKEQQEMINDLLDRIETLENTISGEENSDQSVIITDHNKAVLALNRPNPFNEQTEISYYIPTEANNAYIEFYDMTGRLLKKVQIDSFGKGSIAVNSVDLTPGQYNYTLVVDSKFVDTHKMIYVK